MFLALKFSESEWFEFKNVLAKWTLPLVAVFRNFLKEIKPSSFLLRGKEQHLGYKTNNWKSEII